MVKITAIKPQLKRPDHFAVFVDGKYGFSLSESELIKSQLVQGQVVTAEQLAQVKKLMSVSQAFTAAINQLSYRARSQGEIIAYLKRKAYDPEVIETVVTKLTEGGYVNDLDFARRWVENRRLLKATSSRRLEQELRQHHIADDVIDNVLTADNDNDEQSLRQMIEKKRNRYPDDLKLTQYLVRQGYRYGDIKAALRRV